MKAGCSYPMGNGRRGQLRLRSLETDACNASVITIRRTRRRGVDGRVAGALGIECLVRQVQALGTEMWHALSNSGCKGNDLDVESRV